MKLKEICKKIDAFNEVAIVVDGNQKKMILYVDHDDDYISGERFDFKNYKELKNQLNKVYKTEVVEIYLNVDLETHATKGINYTVNGHANKSILKLFVFDE